MADVMVATYPIDPTVPTVPAIPLEEIDITQDDKGKKTWLGEGTFAKVYKGKWQHHAVAVKIIKATANYAVQALQQEARAMDRVKSNYIIRLHGIGVDRGRCVIVMELMSKSLFDFLHNPQWKIIPWLFRYNIAQDIAYGLQVLHRNDILHCDLKSANVLLDDNYRAKLADFGLSKLKNHYMSSTHRELGTPGWMAPETFMLESDTTITPPVYSTYSDVYAFGMTSWELATRETPYSKFGRDYNNIKVFVKSEGRLSIPLDCTSLFAELIQACWQPIPDRRPSIHDIINELSKIVQGEIIHPTSLQASAAGHIFMPFSPLESASMSLGSGAKPGPVPAPAVGSGAKPSPMSLDLGSMQASAMSLDSGAEPAPAPALGSGAKPAPGLDPEVRPSLMDLVLGETTTRPDPLVMVAAAAASPGPGGDGRPRQVEGQPRSGGNGRPNRAEDEPRGSGGGGRPSPRPRI